MTQHPFIKVGLGDSMYKWKMWVLLPASCTCELLKVGRLSAIRPETVPMWEKLRANRS